MRLVVLFLLATSCVFAQSAWNSKSSIQPKSTIPIPPANTIAFFFGGAGAHCISNSAATMNCQLTSVPANAKITIQFTDNVTTTTVTSVFVCSGTSTCGASVDTINTDVAPTTVSGIEKVAAYSDILASITGNVMVTVVVASFNSPIMFAQVWTGGCTSSCFDQSGTFAAGSVANYSVSTSGNVTASNEAAISIVNSSVTIAAGTTSLCAASACTRLDISGGQAVEYSSTPPTNGTLATMTWANASGNAVLLVVTYK